MALTILPKRKIGEKIYYCVGRYPRKNRDLLDFQKKKLKSQGFNVRSIQYYCNNQVRGWDLYVNRGSAKADPRIAYYAIGGHKGGDTTSLPEYCLIWHKVELK